MKERTLLIIKPDSVEKRHVGDIIRMVEENDFGIEKIEFTKFTKTQAEDFYTVHKRMPFYEELINFMLSGPVVVMVLCATDVVKKLRTLVGATDPKKSATGTIRNHFGSSVLHNAVHASDSTDNSKREIRLFFPT